MKIQKSIALPKDLSEYIAEKAKKEKRSFSSMAEILLEKAAEEIKSKQEA